MSRSLPFLWQLLHQHQIQQHHSHKWSSVSNKVGKKRSTHHPTCNPEAWDACGLNKKSSTLLIHCWGHLVPEQIQQKPESGEKKGRINGSFWTVITASDQQQTATKRVFFFSEKRCHIFIEKNKKEYNCTVYHYCSQGT